MQVIIDFLRTPTPESWVKAAVANLPLLLLDHAHCERKAATTALGFISKHPEKKDIVTMMSPLAREELLHFEKVLGLLKYYKLDFSPLPSSRYAAYLHKKATQNFSAQRLADQLIIGAIIEARSCERFNALIPQLKEENLRQFYAFLVKSEARHFQGYLHLAERYSDNITERLDFFLKIENTLITSPDEVFRFHSGMPL